MGLLVGLLGKLYTATPLNTVLCKWSWNDNFYSTGARWKKPCFVCKKVNRYKIIDFLSFETKDKANFSPPKSKPQLCFALWLLLLRFTPAATASTIESDSWVYRNGIKAKLNTQTISCLKGQKKKNDKLNTKRKHRGPRNSKRLAIFYSSPLL